MQTLVTLTDRVRLTAFSGSSQEGVYTIMPKFMNVEKPTVSGGVSPIDLTAGYINDTSFFLERIRLAEICREIIDALPSMTEDTIEQDYNLIYTLRASLPASVRK